ncbi:MAG TPA: hypothetical protein VK069_06505, partial [Mycolicibacillus parakoreensis]|nr:hypothetical protein [Mycolicibacillus parakoreensis]
LDRERRQRRPVVRAKLWLQDAIAGRPQVHDEVTVTAAVNREVRVASAPTEPIMIRRVRPTRTPSAAADRAASAPTVPIARLRAPGDRRQ